MELSLFLRSSEISDMSFKIHILLARVGRLLLILLLRLVASLVRLGLDISSINGGLG